MDILKVLSRGIKPNPKKNAKAAGVQKLPSAGSQVNPQFFHDNVGSNDARGKKRKRRAGGAPGQEDGTDGDDSDVSDVDYFAPKQTPAAAHADSKKTSADQAEQQNQQQTPQKRKVKLLDEDECRQILRSHRLKFTILAGRTEVEEKKPAKKKSKKEKKEEADTKEDKKNKKKDDKKQIYPQPLNSFPELRHIYAVSPQLTENMTRQGFRVPTEVQMGSLPLLLQPELALKKAKDVEDVDTSRGVDFLGVAPTGSGKTISFLIPAINNVLRRRAEKAQQEAVPAENKDEQHHQNQHVLTSVIVAPTRELATQIVNEGRKLALGTGVRVVLMKRTLRIAAQEEKQAPKQDEKDEKEEGSESESEGEGENEHDEEEDASEGSEEEEDSDAEKATDKRKKEKGPKPIARADILVTTPKILLNFLSGGEKKTGSRYTLPTVESLILDEADVLLDQIFRRQTMGIWRACTNPDLRLTCWSATMASNIEEIVLKNLEKRARRAAAQGTPASQKPLVRLVVGLKDTAVPNVTHKLIYTATEQGKLLALRQLLHPVNSDSDGGPPLRPPFLVFTQTIDRAQSLHDELKYDIPLEAGGSARVAVLHSSLPDSVRSKIMARFRAGEVWVLITTDVLARGVDFAGVNGVVNYDVPTSAAAYVHRAGRTGRAGREGGVAVTFYTKDDIPFVKSVANVIAASEKQAGLAGTEGATIQKWLLDALPKVGKEDKRKLKVRGVEARRAGGKASGITTKSSWERRSEHNRAQAIEASKRRKREGIVKEKKPRGPRKDGEAAAGGDDGAGSDGGEWGGLDN